MYELGVVDGNVTHGERALVIDAGVPGLDTDKMREPLAAAGLKYID